MRIFIAILLTFSLTVNMFVGYGAWGILSGNYAVTTFIKADAPPEVRKLQNVNEVLSRKQLIELGYGQ